MSNLSAKAVTLLSDLEQNLADVVQHLERYGIKGERHRICKCPIAVYLSRETDQDWMVGGSYAETEYNLDEFGYCELPAPVQLFVRSFDSGLFPELEVVA